MSGAAAGGGAPRRGPPIVHDLIGRTLLAAAIALALVGASVAFDLPGRGTAAPAAHEEAH